MHAHWAETLPDKTEKILHSSRTPEQQRVRLDNRYPDSQEGMPTQIIALENNYGSLQECKGLYERVIPTSCDHSKHFISLQFTGSDCAHNANNAHALPMRCKHCSDPQMGPLATTATDSY
jgi:DICT domain-containing protein